MDGGAWWATVHGVGVSQTRLSVHAHVYYILGERYKVKDLIFVKKKHKSTFEKKKKRVIVTLVGSRWFWCLSDCWEREETKVLCGLQGCYLY